jgi:transcriptional regulator with XRE-family HTH domain
VGRRLREFREGRGLTQAQRGTGCRLHPAYIGYVERGERNVSILNLRRIARVLRVPLAGLFEDRDRPQQGGG